MKEFRNAYYVCMSLFEKSKSDGVNYAYRIKSGEFFHTRPSRASQFL